jgi:Zn-dependent M28 family amino/carboxypeptidase
MIKLSTFFILFWVSISSKSQPLLTDSIIDFYSLKNNVSALSNDTMLGRLAGTTTIEKASSYIALQFMNAKLSPIKGNDEYFDHFNFNFNNQLVKGINVVGAIKGKVAPDSIIIFSAHYDHIGTSQEGTESTDSIFNGANDNACGVAVIIELAKYFKQQNENKYTLLFVAFSAEELGLLGSSYMEQNLNMPFVRAVINFDMIGRPSTSLNNKCMVIGKNSREIIKKLNLQLSNQKFFIEDRFPNENLNSRMDHYSFKKIKNSFSISCTSPTDLYYHSVGDELSTINFEFLYNTCVKFALACKIFTQ